jgi:hypothetical protein
LEKSSDPKVRRDSAASFQPLLSRVTAALHTELGVALLAHCYAYYA